MSAGRDDQVPHPAGDASVPFGNRLTKKGELRFFRRDVQAGEFRIGINGGRSAGPLL
jgi:hypothetical protein